MKEFFKDLESIKGRKKSDLCKEQIERLLSKDPTPEVISEIKVRKEVLKYLTKKGE